MAKTEGQEQTRGNAHGLDLELVPMVPNTFPLGQSNSQGQTRYKGWGNRLCLGGWEQLQGLTAVDTGTRMTED